MLRSLLFVIPTLILFGCTGAEFTAGSADASVSSKGDKQGNGTTLQAASECATAHCDVPNCPPQLQYTPEGECCPVCQPPASCAQGASCDNLECPGDKVELDTGCCECADVMCDGDALACTDPQCLGAMKEDLGNGCCNCGEQLNCGENQGACDTILCSGNTLYIGDGCCECEPDTSCGLGSTACGDLSCDTSSESKTEVGGGCCLCEPLVMCDGDSVECATIECTTTVLQVSDGCCACSDEQTTCADQGLTDCSTLECTGTVVDDGSGCCSCEAATTCGANEAACDTLTCPNSDPVEVSTGCCVCDQVACPDGQLPCSNITCDTGEVTPVTDQCCECSVAASGCDAALQDEFSGIQTDLMDKYQVQNCFDDFQCEVIALKSSCRTECNFPANQNRDYDFTQELYAWADENCAECTVADVECPTPAAAVQCIGGTCAFPSTSNAGFIGGLPGASQ